MCPESNANDLPLCDLADVVKSLIFPKLSLVYGQRLTLMYEGLQPNAVMADWVAGLDGVSLESITWGLKNLPATDFPPNVQQFRRICANRPAAMQPPAVSADTRTGVPAFVKEVSRRIREVEDRTESGATRLARSYIARVTASGHCITHNERQWAAHFARIVAEHKLRATGAEGSSNSKGAPEAMLDSGVANTPQ